MPGITLTEGSDVYHSKLRSGDPDLFFTLYMLGGDDQLYTAYPSSLRAYLGAGNDYAQINMMYQAIIYGEDGDDTVDINHSAAWTLNIDGGDGADRVNFFVDKHGVSIAGGAGNDGFYGNNHIISGTIGGGGGDDLFIGFGNYGGSKPNLAGGTGNDTYYVDPAAAPTIIENAGEGNDTIVLLYAAPFTAPANIENLIVQGGSPNTIIGDGLANILSGTNAADSIYGLGGSDTLYGYAENDVLDGGTGSDRLFGGSGSDKLYGGDGADVLRGEAGLDEMWGGAGADGFIFDDKHFGGSTAATCDVIHDFNAAQSDKVRLNLVDANRTMLSDQAFVFIGTAGFGNVAGQLRYEQVSGNTYIQGDVNGDAVADFWIRLDGLHSLASTDFWL